MCTWTSKALINQVVGRCRGIKCRVAQVVKVCALSLRTGEAHVVNASFLPVTPYMR